MSVLAELNHSNSVYNIIICLVAFFASGLTFFSGFGLGTILMPALALFFPIEIAIGATAIVHCANNLFKFGLVYRHVYWSVVLRFGLPAMFAALLGAGALVWINSLPALMTYEFRGVSHEVTLVKLVIGVVLVGFAVFEILPRFQNLQIPSRWLPVGGFVSGFFGGLSGHQGALRSAFMGKIGLTKEAFISSGVVIACLVDFTRLGVYWGRASTLPPDVWTVVGYATLAAFAGAWLGAKLLTKVTLRFVQRTVTIGLFAIGLLLAAGVV